MLKSTLFVAVRCCQCSTMQVKQQKKSSNKWTCAVCNQKQSVTKIYAQGYQAKDIRQVVQSFNMSRMVADDEQYQVPSRGHFVEQMEGDQEMVGERKAKRRTDWSEYVDDMEVGEPAYLKSVPKEAEMFEAKVVTELPEEVVFKKPKLKGTFGSSSSGLGESRTYKRHFSKRVAPNDMMRTRPGTLGVPSVSDEYNMDDRDHTRDRSRHSQQQQQKQTGASKWAGYLADDDGGDCEGGKAAFADDLRLMHGYDLKTNDVDQLVEEDIHPDFM